MWVLFVKSVNKHMEGMFEWLQVVHSCWRKQVSDIFALVSAQQQHLTKKANSMILHFSHFCFLVCVYVWNSFKF